jgi:hypothetical protein
MSIKNIIRLYIVLICINSFFAGANLYQFVHTYLQYNSFSGMSLYSAIFSGVVIAYFFFCMKIIKRN